MRCKEIESHKRKNEELENYVIVKDNEINDHKTTFQNLNESVSLKENEIDEYKNKSEEREKHV